MSNLNATPSSNRLHIGIYGKTNSGKSSLINAITKQKVSIVADLAGTTTDPVYKAMEIHPLGPCTIIDTAGFDDESELGERRIEKTQLAAEKTDIAVIVFDAKELLNAKIEGESFAQAFEKEAAWIRLFSEKKTPILLAVNKIDELSEKEEADAEKTGEESALLKELKSWLLDANKTASNLEVVAVSAKNGEGVDRVKSALTRLLPEDYGQEYILGDLVEEGDLVLLIMPQDIQAPKGRLILPQVQTLRELLDRKCLVMSVTTDKMPEALSKLSQPPKLIITDSQVFSYVYENKPKESLLTSFSVLFAAYKGDLPYYVEGAKAIHSLTEESKVLIAECCTHAPLAEDIGREKLPRMLRKRVGEGLTVDVVSGTDFPQDLSGYDLIIQCGACMFNRKYVLSRIDRARSQGIPMSNYGVTIACLSGILEQVTMP
jgi:[FeFe] hydrogenase H-cluster maturation GTPase HydF